MAKQTINTGSIPGDGTGDGLPSAFEKVNENFDEVYGQLESTPTLPLAQSDVTGLVSALAGKASTTHTHAISDTTGLQTALDGKADTSHTHAQSEVTGLVSALAGKASTTHTHAISDTTGLQTALDGKAEASHTHAQSEVTGLVSALAGKASTTHTHAISDVSGVTAAGEAMMTAASAAAQQALLGITGGGVIALGGNTLTVSTSGTAALLATANVFTAAQSISRGSNSATPADALSFINSTAAVLNTQSASPDVIFTGQVWKTGTGSQEASWRMYALPVQSALPDVELRMGCRTNNGSWTDVFRFTGTDGVHFRGIASVGTFYLIPSFSSNAMKVNIDQALFSVDFSSAVKHSWGATTYTLADGVNLVFNTTTGTKIGTATGQKIGFWNATPVVQQVLATGGGATSDNIIALLQTLGLCRQS